MHELRAPVAAVLTALDAYEGGRSVKTFNELLRQVKTLRLGVARLAQPPAPEPLDQAMVAIAGMPRPYPTLAFLSLAGSSTQHIAKTLDLDPALVSQLRSKLVAKLRPLL